MLGDVTNVAGAAASGAGAAAEPEPEAGVRTRRGGGGRRGKKAQQAPAPPPPPPALDIIREAVATDPARQLQVKKTESQWTFRLQPRDIAVGAAG